MNCYITLFEIIHTVIDHSIKYSFVLRNTLGLVCNFIISSSAAILQCNMLLLCKSDRYTSIINSIART